MADYAGDVTPEQAWAELQSNPDAVLVDVRTRPEWGFVGVPDLSGAGKQAALISWQVYPEMGRNATFEAEVEALGAKSDAPVYFLCRSGARSRAAAIAMTARGFSACYNVAYGFEGDPDSARHRGLQNGWKASNLPWVQQ
ncbi:rhodanese-like domain-containing protein [Govanella unica]|uniref:Rhodanese-like domain-containing protein n=1 Tax=Govanella unica TaxID=2975056 RepID=A0A9X3TZJ3_9PROT|nr:rhodanese-like domain-containing protein [Govania unica]MDA5194639.1 rhodanese-like domain-containing protein [Govania unica]